MFALTYPPYIHEKARYLRAQRRLTIGEIAERLAVSRTSVYGWVRDIDVPRAALSSSALAGGREKAAAANRARHAAERARAYEGGRAEYAMLVREPTFVDFVCMYIGEGYKRSRHTVSICNSDSAVVRLGDHWIRRFGSTPIRYSLQFHAGQDLEALQDYWARLLGVAPDEIKLQRKSNSGRLAGRTWRSQWGVLNVACHDTKFRARLGAWIDSTRATWP